MSNNQPAQLTYTVAETALVLGVSARTVYRQIAAGDLHAVRFGSRVLVPVATVNDMLTPPGADNR